MMTKTKVIYFIYWSNKLIEVAIVFCCDSCLSQLSLPAGVGHFNQKNNWTVDKNMINKIKIAMLAIVLLQSGCKTIENKKQAEPESSTQKSFQTFQVSHGMEVSIAAPTGFNITQEHYGFVQPESFSRIKISEKEIPFSTYIANLSKENLLKSQLQLIKQEQVTVHDALCTLFTLRQNIAGTYFEKLWMLSGDNLSTLQIEASYPEGANHQLKQAIKDSLLNFSVATQQKHRIFTGLPFMLTATPEFKIKQRYTNSVVLTPLEESSNKESIVISHGATQSETDDIQQLSEHFLNNSKSYKKISIIQNKMIKLDNIPALATTAEVELNGQPSFIYQVLSYQKKRFLLIQGQVNNSEKNTFNTRFNNLLTYFKFK